MTTTAASPVIRSWAQMVQGDDKKVEDTQNSIKPSRRGSLMRFCRGEVLSMLTNYGWLMVYGNVDHPSSAKHGGDVYIHKDDIMDGESLCPGDIVSFYLYVDEQGLGAEMCTVEQKASIATPTTQQEMISVNACAKEFVPAGGWSKPAVKKMAGVFARLSQAFAWDDEDDDEGFAFVSPWKAKAAPSSDGSTCGGDTSESEQDDDVSDCESELSLSPLKLTAPPGLHPPGLEVVMAF